MSIIQKKIKLHDYAVDHAKSHAASRIYQTQDLKINQNQNASSLPSLSPPPLSHPSPSTGGRRPQHSGGLRAEPAPSGSVRAVRAGQRSGTGPHVLRERRQALQAQRHVPLRAARQLWLRFAAADQRHPRSSAPPPL